MLIKKISGYNYYLETPIRDVNVYLKNDDV